MLSGLVKAITKLSVKIVLTDERKPYFFGDPIFGKVIVENNDPALKCLSVYVRVRGFAYVRVDNNSDHLSDSVYNKSFPVCGEKECETTVWDVRNNSTPFFPTGTTELPFTIDTSKLTKTPASHDCGKGAIRWHLEVTFHRPLNLDVTNKCCFTIIPRVSVNDPIMAQPVSKSAVVGVIGVVNMKTRGVVEAVVQLDHQGYLPGQTAHINAICGNQCDADVTASAMTVRIFQCNRCVENASKTGTKSFLLFEQVVLNQPVNLKSLQCVQRPIDIVIPAGVPSFQHPNVTVSYSMNVVAQTNRGKVEVACPFVLCSFAAAQAPPPGFPGQYPYPPQAGAPAPYPAGAPAPYPAGAPAPCPAGAPAPYPGGAPAPYPGGAPAPYPAGAPAPYPGGAPAPYPGGAPAPYPGGAPAPYPAGAPGQYSGAPVPYPGALAGAPAGAPAPCPAGAPQPQTSSPALYPPQAQTSSPALYPPQPQNSAPSLYPNLSQNPPQPSAPSQQQYYSYGAPQPGAQPGAKPLPQPGAKPLPQPGAQPTGLPPSSA